MEDYSFVTNFREKYTIPIEYYPGIISQIPYNFSKQRFPVEVLVQKGSLNLDRSESYLYSSNSSVSHVSGRCGIFKNRMGAFKVLYLKIVELLATNQKMQYPDFFITITNKILSAFKDGYTDYDFLNEELETIVDTMENSSKHDLEDNEKSREIYENDIILMANFLKFDTLLFQMENVGSVILSIPKLDLENLNLHYEPRDEKYTGNYWFPNENFGGHWSFIITDHEGKNDTTDIPVFSTREIMENLNSPNEKLMNIIAYRE